MSYEKFVIVLECPLPENRDDFLVYTSEIVNQIRTHVPENIKLLSNDAKIHIGINDVAEKVMKVIYGEL